jgi:hypothetical protein
MISPRDKLDRARSPRRRAEKPDKYETRGGRGLKPITVQPKKSWQLAEQHGPWWVYEGDLPPPEAFPRLRTPRTDTWAIPVPYNCGGAAAAASRTSPRLTLRQ